MGIQRQILCESCQGWEPKYTKGYYGKLISNDNTGFINMVKLIFDALYTWG